MSVLQQPVMRWRVDPRTADKWNEPPYESASPNLVALTNDLRQRFGGGSMGIHWDRDTASGFRSEHSWGAGLDHGTGQAQVDWMRSKGIATGPAMTLAQHHAMCDWVVAHSAELQIDAIVSIGRSWKSDRVSNGAGGWQAYQSGYTGHSHFVTTFDGYHNATPIAERLAPSPPTTEDDDDMLNRDTLTIRKHRSGALWLTTATSVQPIEEDQRLHYINRANFDPPVPQTTCSDALHAKYVALYS